MRTSHPEKWRTWRKHIEWRCEELTKGKDLPISFKDISLRCRVKQVIFQPMLVEAGLAIDNDGFVIFVRCDDKDVQNWTAAFNDPQGSGQQLPGRVRFSLAHEIVHTFFYDTNRTPYKSRLKEEHHREIDSLEAACNYGAARLLLPTSSLKDDMERQNVLSVDFVSELTKKYRVSFECLIHRIRNLEDWTDQRGLLAYIKEEVDSVYRIRAIAKAASVRGLFAHSNSGDDFRTLLDKQLYQEIRSKRAKTGSFDYKLSYRKNLKTFLQSYFIEYRRINDEPDTFVLALETTETPIAYSKQIERKADQTKNGQMGSG
jgi:IrrE N-terminal-like domain